MGKSATIMFTQISLTKCLNLQLKTDIIGYFSSSARIFFLLEYTLYCQRYWDVCLYTHMNFNDTPFLIRGV